MKIFTLFLFLFTGLYAFSQAENDTVVTPEARFALVRTLADSGDYQVARQLSAQLLAESPGYTDVSVYLALIYGRESLFDSAFALLEPVLKTYPLNSDAHLANCALLYWKNDWNGLLSATALALELLPDDPDLLFKRALALYNLGMGDESLALLDQLLRDNPGHSQGKNLLTLLQSEKESSELFIRYLFDHFRNPYIRRWHMVSAGANLPFSSGTISPYLNAGHFVDETIPFHESSALQLNTDIYLNITERNYLLAGYGIGTGTFLPRHRALLSIWQTLPAGWSVSAGVRYFYFDRHYIFYAAGLEKYLGNSWIELNNYIFKKEYGLSVSSYLTVRRYLENRYNYLSATLGYGTSPDEPLTSVAELQRLNAFSMRFSVMRQIRGPIRISVGAAYHYEEYVEQTFRNRIDIQTSIFYKL